MTIEQMIKILSQIGDVEIKYSKYTNGFYVSMSAEIAENKMLKGSNHHCDAIEESVRLTFEDYTKAELVVTGAYSDKRREYKYNNGHFMLLN